LGFLTNRAVIPINEFRKEDLTHLWITGNNNNNNNNNNNVFLFLGREIFVGLSSRTNMLGAQAVAKAFPEYSTTVVRVYSPAVHLKDYINVVQPEVLVVSKSPAAQRTFMVRYIMVT
jgi:N-dimethylarginine dimethylaminohydrolase